MKIKPIQNYKPKSRVAVQGASGSGKSYTALLLAYGLSGAYEKVTVIETDYQAANHYSYLGSFNTLTLNAPFTPEKFIEAIELCERSGIEVIIIDTLSAEWVDIGGMQERMMEEGATCIQWHQSLLHSIQNSPCHIIATIRSKECFHLRIKGNNREVQKVGLDPIQQEGIHYHFHTVLSLDMCHKAKSLKDRTSFFEEHSSLVITEELAALFAKWCTSNVYEIPEQLQERINGCRTIKELLDLMFQNDTDDCAIMQAFYKRRLELEGILNENPIFSLHKQSQNGNYPNRA